MATHRLRPHLVMVDGLEALPAEDCAGDSEAEMKELVGVFIMLLWLGMAVGNIVWVSEFERLCENNIGWSTYVGVAIVAPAFWSIFMMTPINERCGEE